MIKKTFIISLILFSNSLFADPSFFKGLSLNKSRSSEEFILVFNHIRKDSRSQTITKPLIDDLYSINKNLTVLDDIKALFFIKSEFYKFYLNNSKTNNVQSFQVSQSHILSIRDKFKRNNDQYSAFAKFIIKKVLNDFNPFIENNFLNDYIALKDSKEFAKREQLKKTLEYLSSWVSILSQSTPVSLDIFLNKLSLSFIKNLKIKSHLFNTESRESNFAMTVLNLDEKSYNLYIKTLEKKAKTINQNTNILESLPTGPSEDGQSKQIDNLIDNISN